METIIRNVYLLSGLLPDEELTKLTVGALQHRKFSRITFEILAASLDFIKVQTIQGKTTQENYADEETLILRTKELFNRFLPDRKIIVSATMYGQSVTE